MYPRLLLNLCKRSSYRASSGVRLNFKRSSHVANKDLEKRETEIVSTKFPDYRIIYIFPFIKQVSGINALKRRFTILTGAATPVIISLHLVNILPFEPTVASIITGLVTTIWLHSLGIFCNNLIGYIYLKLEEEKVILSYVNYWGKRRDLEVSLNEVIPISDNSVSGTDFLYRKVMFSSQKQSLKINLQLGRITDMENFKCVLGTI